MAINLNPSSGSRDVSPSAKSSPSVPKPSRRFQARSLDQVSTSPSSVKESASTPVQFPYEVLGSQNRQGSQKTPSTTTRPTENKPKASRSLKNIIPDNIKQEFSVMKRILSPKALKELVQNPIAHAGQAEVPSKPLQISSLRTESAASVTSQASAKKASNLNLNTVQVVNILNLNKPGRGAPDGEEIYHLLIGSSEKNKEYQQFIETRKGISSDPLAQANEDLKHLENPANLSKTQIQGLIKKLFVAQDAIKVGISELTNGRADMNDQEMIATLKNTSEQLNAKMQDLKAKLSA